MERKLIPRTDALAIAAFCLLVVSIAVLAEATSSAISVFGAKIPPLCPFRLLTGLDCPGCGLTRSLILAFHGRFVESYMVHLLGIPLAVFFLVQIPYQLYAAFSSKPFETRKFLRPGLSYLVLGCLFLSWTLKTIAVALILWF
jgi:Protein of unknown function (DUF2752)